jgi:cation diffusion facilitator CzcD-associated flavoprotein CzcO
MIMEQIETVIIGGGQAGLAMSYCLSQLGREHVILERQRVAERWRSERWDSLTFQSMPLGMGWTFHFPMPAPKSCATLRKSPISS